MDQERTDLVKRVFQEALDRDETERAAFVDAACEGNEGARDRVMDLLRAYAGADGFLSLAGREGVGDAPGYVGTTIGPYKVLQIIGEGGFGTVYMAEQQEPIRRRVALKLIKLGMDTKQVVARFEAERQALAMMEHPNIARVLDAGATESGRPYFVMELVSGTPITEYCDEHCLSTKERLELFTGVCAAVQHAHQKGVIHRDLKPSNVLVAIRDDRPIPKVIDFGVARATAAHRLTDKTLFTEFGQFIGTPMYMSPEQAEAGGVDVDTRSDVYSLGVLLYELLTGTTPFTSGQIRNVAYAEVLRVLQQVDPPPPSTRVSELSASGDPVARLRRSEPGALQRLLRGDLDWIVMKALEKDRSRRYASASELAADIGRYFVGDPVSAGPPDLSYRVRKIVRRNRGKTAAAAAVLAAVVVGGFAAGWQAVQATAAAERARANAILAYAATAEDPLLKALLIDEIADVPDMPGKLAVLREAANHPLPVSVVRVPDFANDVTYSPDGQYMAAAFVDGNAWVWRRDGTGQPRILSHGEEVYRVVFSPDGSRVATGTSDGMVRVWPLDGEDPAVLEAEGRIAELSFSPDGELISAGTDSEDDGPVWIWRADGTADPVVIEDSEHVLAHAGDGLRGGLFFPDGERILTWGHDAAIWRIDGTGPIATLPGDWEGGGSNSKMSPDGRLIAVGHPWGVRIHAVDGSSEPITIEHEGISGGSFNGEYLTTVSRDGVARIWDLNRPDRPVTLPSPDVTRAVLSRDGSRVFASSSDGRIRVWGTDGSGPVAVFVGPGRGSAVAESPNGRRVISHNIDLTLREWSLEEIHGEALVLPHDTPAHAVAFSPDGRQVATGADDGAVRIWSADGAGGAIVLQAHDRFDGRVPSWQVNPPVGVSSVRFSPDGQRLVSTSWDGTAKVWETNGAGEAIILPHGAFVQDAAFSPDGERVVTGGRDGRVLVWPSEGTGGAPEGPYPIRFRELPEGATLVTQHDDWVASVSFSPDGRKVISASEVAQITDLEGADPPLTLRGTYYVADAEFSPDGEWVILGAEEGDLRLFPTRGGAAQIMLEGRGGFEPSSVAFSPDGKRVVAGTRAGTARVWRLDGTEDPIELTGHADRVTGVAFSPDGTRVATSSLDGTVRIWRVTFPELLEHVRSNLRACLTPEQRIRYLAEGDGEAGEKAAACERRLWEDRSAVAGR